MEEKLYNLIADIVINFSTYHLFSFLLVLVVILFLVMEVKSSAVSALFKKTFKLEKKEEKYDVEDSSKHNKLVLEKLKELDSTLNRLESHLLQITNTINSTMISHNSNLNSLQMEITQIMKEISSLSTTLHAIVKAIRTISETLTVLVTDKNADDETIDI